VETQTRRVGSRRTFAAGGVPFAIIVPAVARDQILSVVVGLSLVDNFGNLNVARDRRYWRTRSHRHESAVPAIIIKGAFTGVRQTPHERRSSSKGAHHDSERTHHEAHSPLRLLINTEDAGILLQVRKFRVPGRHLVRDGKVSITVSGCGRCSSSSHPSSTVFLS